MRLNICQRRYTLDVEYWHGVAAWEWVVPDAKVRIVPFQQGFGDGAVFPAVGCYADGTVEHL